MHRAIPPTPASAATLQPPMATAGEHAATGATSSPDETLCWGIGEWSVLPITHCCIDSSPCPRPGIRHARIQQWIDQVDDQVDADEDGRRQHHNALHHRNVLGTDGPLSQPTDAFSGEHRFGDHGTGQEIPTITPDRLNTGTA